MSLEGLVTNEPNTEEIEKIDDSLYKLFKPTAFVGSKGLYISYKKNFEEMSFVLSQSTSRNPKEMTVLEYYQAFDTLKAQRESSK